MAIINYATAKVILFTSKTLKDDSNPVLLRITYQRKRRYYSIGVSSTPKEWEKIINQNPKKEYKEKHVKVKTVEVDADKIINRFKEDKIDFSFALFEKKMFTPPSQGNSVLNYFDTLIKDLESQERFGSASAYLVTKRVILKYWTKKDLEFNDITPDFLNKLESHLKKDNTINSIGIYMRTLRAVYNHAIKNECAKMENYPFRLYKIKSEPTVKRALKKEQIVSIYNYVAEPFTPKWFAKTYFLFSYLTQGMNFKDIALLKWNNLVDDRIFYVRAKTKNTAKTPKVFSIKITEQIKDILDSFKKEDQLLEDYIFPIVKPNVLPKKQAADIKQANKIYNKYLKTIGEDLQIENKITSYVSRHSYATVLKRSNVPTSVISESLGHHTEKTTQVYLDSFENSVLDSANENLL